MEFLIFLGICALVIINVIYLLEMPDLDDLSIDTFRALIKDVQRLFHNRNLFGLILSTLAFLLLLPSYCFWSVLIFICNLPELLKILWKLGYKRRSAGETIDTKKKRK